MKKIIISVSLGLFIIGGTQPIFASELDIHRDIEITNNLNRATLKPWFKKIPPLKYKGRTRINYYPNSGGYIGVYL
ncbi:hypothetical protein R6Z02_09455 [Carnobacterium maltaromaticum]|uniref:hypothetical protein n=1 Tax=Carnobacterium maltaromaticum TaxID=2751 RepID=UPI00298B1AB2|nr:hypothetical protein [Carnobacterium maltaromaticum]MDW5523977.1 hypothetical protein [Carnobacterium maltaromaticum]